MIELILLERVENLGQMGQVVKVRPGFARNFLLPQKKALRATKDNLAYFDKQRAQLEAQNLTRKGEAEQVASKLNGVHVVIIRQAGESGQLYGSVSARDIADATTAAGFSVSRSQVVLDKPIKALGLYKTRVVLHPEVSVMVTANIAQSREEAEMQEQGVDPLSLARAAADREATEARKEADAVFEKPAEEEAKEAAPAAAPVEEPAEAEKPKAKRAKKAAKE